MDFDYSPKTKELQARLLKFMDDYIYPNEKSYKDELEANTAAGKRWTALQTIENLKDEVRDIGEDSAAAWAVTGTGERLAADDLVICAGIGSASLTRRLGLRSILMPMKGYSFTVPLGPSAPQISITDVARKIVLCRLGGMVRVAGLAEIGARSAAVDPAALERLRRAARASLPGAANYEQIGPGWAGIRPMTASSLPRIERVSLRLAVNIGHGMLGWTYSMGCAERLASVVLEGVA